MTSIRQLIALPVILALAACAERSGVTGRVPEKPTRERAEFAPAPHPDRQTAYDERSLDPVVRAPTVEAPEESQVRFGVAGTNVFHRANCDLVKDVPASEVIRFTSPWDAVDAHYSPCEHCRAMR